MKTLNTFIQEKFIITKNTKRIIPVQTGVEFVNKYNFNVIDKTWQGDPYKYEIPDNTAKKILQIIHNNDQEYIDKIKKYIKQYTQLPLPKNKIISFEPTSHPDHGYIKLHTYDELLATVRIDIENNMPAVMEFSINLLSNDSTDHRKIMYVVLDYILNDIK